MSMIRALMVLVVLCTTFAASLSAGAHTHDAGAVIHGVTDALSTSATSDCCDHSTERAPICHVWVALLPHTDAAPCAAILRRAGTIGPPVRLSGLAPPFPLDPPRAG